MTDKSLGREDMPGRRKGSEGRVVWRKDRTERREESVKIWDVFLVLGTRASDWSRRIRAAATP